MVFNKKAISPVVATALLLVVAVVAVVGVQGWYRSFQSAKLVDVSDQADQAAGFTVQAVSATTPSIYVKNSASTALNVTSVIIDGTVCTATAGMDSITIAGSSTGNISLATCSATAGSSTVVTVVTTNGLITETLTAIT